MQPMILIIASIALFTFAKSLTPASNLLYNFDRFLDIKKFEHVSFGEINEGQCTLKEFTKNLPANTYNVTDHNITTDHGYILQMFRVRLNNTALANLSKNDQENISRPVLIQHGLFDDATSMIQNLNTTFSFYMLNKGFDVWFGNNRGNKFSLDNTNSKIDDEDFYDYSFTEMGLTGVPAFYKEILLSYPEDPSKKIIYFGHSEGTSQMFAALSDPISKTYVRAHTERFFALSPIAYMTQITTEALSWVSNIEQTIDFAANVLHVWQIGGLNCDDESPQWAALAYQMCKRIAFLCDRSDLSLGDLSDDGASVKQLAHYAQLIKGGDNGVPVFRPYDYGTNENMDVYGQPTPPEWDFSDWTTPTNLVIGEEDPLGTPANVDILIGKLPKTLDLTSNIIPGWAHSTCLKPDDDTPLIDIINKALNLQ